MALLVGHGVKRHAQRIRQRLPLPLSRQKAGHIGALHRPRPGTGPHGGQAGQPAFRPQLGKAPRQVFDVLEQRVALPQTQLAGAHLQQPAGVIAAAAVKYRRRGGVVACVDAQCAHITPRPAAAPPLA